MSDYLLNRSEVADLSRLHREIEYARACLAVLIRRNGGTVDISHQEIGESMPSDSIEIVQRDDGITLNRR